MPVHDWTRVEAGIFHHFHGFWIPQLCLSLNDGGLPSDYYALIDQVTGIATPDVLTLSRPQSAAPSPRRSGGVATATATPAVRFHTRSRPQTRRRPQKSVAIRHVSTHQIVAMIEVVSPGNKGSTDDFRQFVRKSLALLRAGIHLLLIDVFPPGPRDPNGLHAAIWARLHADRFVLPADKPLTQVGYAAGTVIDAFVHPVAVGDPLPEMPLFLTHDEHVPVSLERTYQQAWAAVPPDWRDVLTR